MSASTSCTSKSGWGFVSSIETAAQLSLTEPGRVYFERCKTILDDLEETELELGSLNSAPRGTLRVTAPAWFAGQAFANFLADYCRRYPEIVLDLSLEDRDVDIVAEGYDLALRVTREDLPAGLIARRVHSVRFLIAASRHLSRPAWYARALRKNSRLTIG